MRIWVDTQVGPIWIESASDRICALGWGAQGRVDVRADAVLRDARAQVTAYFSGRLTRFDLPLALGPGEFQRRFQDALMAIPFGQTRTYGDLAKELGVSAQAAGQACGANSIPIIVPCHRVLAAQGLGGFSGVIGIETKVSLLKHEGAASLLI